MNVMLIVTVWFVVFGLSSGEDVDLCGKNLDVSYDKYTTTKSKDCRIQKDTVYLRKCCGSGFYHHHDENFFEGRYESACIKHNYTNSMSFKVPIYKGTEKQYDYQDEFVVGMLNCRNREWQYFKMNNSDPNEKFFIQADGTLFYPLWNKFYNNDRFCVDEEDGLTVHLCYTEDAEKWLSRFVNSIGMIISMPFLLATFLVYLLIPKPNLHRKILMSYVLSLLIAYIVLVTVQLYPGQFGDSLCELMGYSIIFFFLMSFFWMNVMCVDIWQSFGKRKFGEKKQFSIYLSYAVGIPIIHVGIVYFINKFGNFEASYYPGVGTQKCFLNDYLPNLLYFYGPISVLITVNVVLFIMTALKIRNIKKEVHTLKQLGYNKDTENQKESSLVSMKETSLHTFSLCTKLFFAMGITWVMEIVSWATQWKMGNDIPAYIWYLTDLCNALYGVFIFIVFVCRKSIWKALKRRYFSFENHPIVTEVSYEMKK